MCLKYFKITKSSDVLGLKKTYVPCGMCPECREAQRNEWSKRLMLELAPLKEAGWSVGFLTLTYKPECLPFLHPSVFEKPFDFKYVPCFSRNDVTKYIKAIRHDLDRYYGVQGLRNLNYSNREYGYWITIMAIVPESGMCQAVDAVNTRTLSKNDFYQPEFDGKGMEITPYNEVIGQADWTNNTDTNAPLNGTALTHGFGFIPRYSRFKVKQNVMNGDMSIRGVRSTYLPFTGDRFCEVADRKVLDVVNFTDHDDFKAYLSTPVSQLPTAGDVWRYPARYQFLGNFDRLFYNNNLAERYNSQILNQLANSNIQWGFSTWEIIRKTYDNFMVHNIMTFVTHAPMLPIEDSFETKEEGNDGKGDSVIRKA